MPPNSNQIEKRGQDVGQTYTTDLYQQIFSLVDRHVYDSYSGAGKSIYTVAACLRLPPAT